MQEKEPTEGVSMKRCREMTSGLGWAKAPGVICIRLRLGGINMGLSAKITQLYYWPSDEDLIIMVSVLTVLTVKFS